MGQYYKPGDWNVICDRTGFKIKGSQARREWTGELVRKTSWEERHPQDFPAIVRATKPVRDARPDKLAVDRTAAAYPAGILLDENGQPLLTETGQWIY